MSKMDYPDPVDEKGIGKTLRQLIYQIYLRHKDKAWDTVWCVVGDEGKGKSNLALWILHYWLLHSRGKVVPGDARHMCLDREMFAADLKDLKPVECTVFDETDLISRRSMDTFNVSMLKAYNIIRGDCLLTVLVLPNFWDLDTYFRNRRVKGLFHVRKRGEYAFYDQTKLRVMAGINQKKMVKRYDVIYPNFLGNFAKYEGPMLEGYMKNKTAKMSQVRKDFYDSVAQNARDEPKNVERRVRAEISGRMLAAGYMKKQIAESLGVSVRTVNAYLQWSDSN